MKYESLERNHVILPNRLRNLRQFLDSEYEGHKHKQRHATNSNSEDALTWSCFDYIRNQSRKKQRKAIQDIVEDVFAGEIDIQNDRLREFTIDVGENRGTPYLFLPLIEVLSSGYGNFLDELCLLMTGFDRGQRLG